MISFRSLFCAIVFLVSANVAATCQQDASAIPANITPAMAQGNLIKKIAPIYSPLARQARIEGKIVLLVTIADSGDVKGVQVVSGHPMLAPAAIEAVKQWKYKPFLVDGNAVEVQTQVEVIFKLAGGVTTPDSADGDQPDDDSADGANSANQRGGIVDVRDGASATPRAAVPQRVRVSQGVLQGLVIKRVAPAYPADAREARIQGQVLMRVVIDKEGYVTEVQLISGHPSLAPAAMDAVKHWKYKPFTLNGEPVEVESQVQVNFTLRPN